MWSPGPTRLERRPRLALKPDAKVRAASLPFKSAKAASSLSCRSELPQMSLELLAEAPALPIAWTEPSLTEGCCDSPR